MAISSVHYRVDLGGYQQKNSYVIQSAIGIDWENVPPELEQVLRTVPNNDILDFALGGNGQFYVKYRLGIQTTCKASLDVIRLAHCDMASVDGLAIGGPASYWLRCNSPNHGRTVVMRGLKLARIQDPDARSTIRSPAIRFLNLGANRHYCFRLGDIFLTSHNGLRSKVKNNSKNVMSAVISSFDPGHHLIIVDDGSVELAVPKAWSALFRRHMTLKNSLISSSAIGPQGSAVSASPTTWNPGMPNTVGLPPAPKVPVAPPVRKAFPDPTVFFTLPAQTGSPALTPQIPNTQVTQPAPRAPFAQLTPKPFIVSPPPKPIVPPAAPKAFIPLAPNAIITKPVYTARVVPVTPKPIAAQPMPSLVIPPAPKAVFVPFVAPPAPMTTVLRPLSSWSEQGNTIIKLFDKSWKHPEKRNPRRVVGVYSIELPEALQTSNLEYRLRMLDKAVESGQLHYEDAVLRFHGTRRSCQIGDSRSQLDLCQDIFCSVCSILRSSFKMTRAGTVTTPGRAFQRFGLGIYTSSVSSKAHDYTVLQANSSFRAMFVASVSLGQGYSLSVTTTRLTKPPTGYDSVLGEVGLHLNYDEQVVYTDDAIRPEYLIIYEP